MQRDDGWSSRLLFRKLSLSGAKPVRKAPVSLHVIRHLPNQRGIRYGFENIVRSCLFLLSG